jgi:hypothetical protein
MHNYHHFLIMQVILVQGPPASGKSTFVRELVEKGIAVAIPEAPCETAFAKWWERDGCILREVLYSPPIEHRLSYLLYSRIDDLFPFMAKAGIIHRILSALHADLKTVVTVASKEEARLVQKFASAFSDLIYVNNVFMEAQVMPEGFEMQKAVALATVS